MFLIIIIVTNLNIMMIYTISNGITILALSYTIIAKISKISSILYILCRNIKSNFNLWSVILSMYKFNFRNFPVFDLHVMINNETIFSNLIFILMVIIMITFIRIRSNTSIIITVTIHGCG